MVPQVGPESVMNVLANTAFAERSRRCNDMVALEEFVLHAIVLVFFDFLES